MNPLKIFCVLAALTALAVPDVVLIAQSNTERAGHSLGDTVQEAWVARYSGPGNDRDEARAIAIDASGNVYVTGYSAGLGTGYDYATIKYNSSGDTVWVRRYNGPGNSYDAANALVVDASGNVYVTGAIDGSYPGYYLPGDYYTIKYNPFGDVQWAARYNGPGNGVDEATALAVDASGNVYVTGGSYDSSTSYDCTTIKYNSSGDTVWVRRYIGLGNSDDVGVDIAVDAIGNIYVTGLSGVYSNYDYLTIKYNSSGDTVWVRRYNGPGNDYDVATSLAIDTSDNVYVTGQSGGSGTYGDYATIKYDGSGNTLWARRYNGPGNVTDQATALAIDASGNVYVTGYSAGLGTGIDYATIKYNSSGDTVWVRRYNNPNPGYAEDDANALAIDASGNVYVTGSSVGINLRYDYATIKYNSSGVEQWVARYDGPGNFTDGATALAIDASGHVYVTGYSASSDNPANPNYDYATIKYTQISTSVREVGTDVPAKFVLEQNYPNPFNPSTTIIFSLPSTAYATLKVFNTLGQQVATLLSQELAAGTYETKWVTSTIGSGVYFYRLQAGSFTETKKLILLK